MPQIRPLRAKTFPNMREFGGTFAQMGNDGIPGVGDTSGPFGKEFFDPPRHWRDLEGLVEDGIHMGSDRLVEFDIPRVVDIEQDRGESACKFAQRPQALDEFLRRDGIDEDEVRRIVGDKLVQHPRVRRRDHIVAILKQHRQAEAEVQVRAVQQDGLLVLTTLGLA